MAKIRILVIDDEPLAREGILSLLADDPEVEVIGSCGDGLTAIDQIRERRPDLVFLDIQMPKPDGFDVLTALKREARPHVIFVTAYDRHAIRAFAAHALDYLLKPYDDARFAAALARAKAEIGKDRLLELAPRMERLLEYMNGVAGLKPGSGAPLPAPEPAVDRVVLKTGTDLNFIKTADIIWIEAQADFVKVHTTGTAQMVRETMASLEQRLDPQRFLRVHRSSLVNVQHVIKVTPALYGDYTVLMSDDTQLKLSRKNRGKLKELIARLSAQEAR